MSINVWRGVTVRARRVQAAALAASLAGCSTGSSLNPIDWWHGLQDGPIAGVRQPPPNADAPYPSLGSVPAKPTLPDASNRTRVLAGLTADRANAQYTEAQTPIGRVPPPAAPPKPQAASQAADADEVSGATMPAASAPPRPAPPRPAPVEKAAQAGLPAPAPQARPVPARALPEIPAAPPPPPSFAGIPSTAPSPPAFKPPPPRPAAVKVVPGGPVSVAFAPDSAVLPPDAAGSLAQLAKTRGTGMITVTGFGEAAATDAHTQSAALPLALARARALTASLLAAGVPASAITLGAEAIGRGGVAQVAN